jgi:hypothetical protein
MFWLLTTFFYLVQWLWLYDLNRVEAGWCLLALAAAAAGIRWNNTGRLLGSLAHRKNLAILSAGAAALAIRALILPLAPIPAPLITDEFSHLLLADTLASGRLSNPPHPMWRHFESIHVLEQPTHSSMYFPAQGAILALGKVIFGHAWWGVWLSNGLMCAALCWMLQQWLPPGWALFGGAVAVLRFSVFSYWNDSYWGGAVPALGGALVLGATARIRRRPSRANGLIFGIGAVVLLFSRPYEGCALCAAALFVCRKQLLSKATVAMAALLCVGGAGLSYYCYRVTGNPLRLPYQVNQEAYGWPMTLLWYRPHGIITPHRELREYYNWELSEHTRFLPDSTVMKGQFLWGFFLGPCLTIPLFCLHRKDRRVRPLIIMGGVVLAAVLVEQTGYPHYFSPATGALLALVVQGVRHMRQGRLGYAFAQMIPLILIATLAVRAVAGPIGLHYTSMAHLLSWCCVEDVKMGRASLKAKLEKMPGKYLVIVHYAPKHSFAREWVYNDPDIDASKIVWARDMGAENDELKQYFKDRQLVDVVVDDDR